MNIVLPILHGFALPDLGGKMVGGLLHILQLFA